MGSGHVLKAQLMDLPGPGECVGQSQISTEMEDY